MGFEDLPLTDYQRARILLLRDNIDEETEVVVDSSPADNSRELSNGRTASAPDSHQSPKEPSEKTSPSPSQSAQEKKIGQTAALYHQLEMARLLKQRLESSVRSATEHGKRNGEKRRHTGGGAQEERGLGIGHFWAQGGPASPGPHVVGAH